MYIHVCIPQHTDTHHSKASVLDPLMGIQRTILPQEYPHLLWPFSSKVYDIDLAAWCGLWLHVHVHVYEAEAYYHEYYVAGSRSALSS